MTDEQQTTALVEETAPAPEPIPADLAAFEEVELALADLDPRRPLPHFTVKDDTDAERLMARIKTLRLGATNGAAGLDSEIAMRKTNIDALNQVIATLRLDVDYLQSQRAALVAPYEAAEALYRPSLDAYLLAKIDSDPKSEKSLVLQSGKLLSVQPPAKWSYDDKALAAWADVNLPAVVKKEPVVNKAELKKLVKVEGGQALHPETGAPVPGVTIINPPREITLEVTL